MHRRARHLNPKDAGASLVLDARYINQADKTAVSRWTDRSANNFNIVQPTGSQQPTFETNVLNGNNSLRFISTANQFLCGGDILDIGTNNFAAIVVGRSTAGTNQGFYAKTDLGITNGAFAYYRSAAAGRFAYGNGATSISVDYNSIPERFSVQTQIVTRGNYVVNYIDGLSGTQNATATNTSSYTPNYAFEVGNLGQGFFPLSGYMSQLIIFINPTLYAFNYKATALMKRIEHASAFSFKIACA